MRKIKYCPCVSDTFLRAFLFSSRHENSLFIWKLLRNCVSFVYRELEKFPVPKILCLYVIILYYHDGCRDSDCLATRILLGPNYYNLFFMDLLDIYTTIKMPEYEVVMDLDVMNSGISWMKCHYSIYLLFPFSWLLTKNTVLLRTCMDRAFSYLFHPYAL